MPANIPVLLQDVPCPPLLCVVLEANSEVAAAGLLQDGLDGHVAQCKSTVSFDELPRCSSVAVCLCPTSVLIREMALPQVGSTDENELILTAVLDALHETLLILLRGQVCIPGALELSTVARVMAQS